AEARNPIHSGRARPSGQPAHWHWRPRESGACPEPVEGALGRPEPGAAPTWPTWYLAWTAEVFPAAGPLKEEGPALAASLRYGAPARRAPWVGVFDSTPTRGSAEEHFGVVANAEWFGRTGG